MATNGSLRVNVISNGHIYLLLSWSLSSQNVANNTSTIAWNLKLVSVGNGANIISSQPKACKVIIDGKTVADTTVSVAINAGATRTLASGTTTAAHDADGTKVFEYSFTQQFDINYAGTQIGTKSGKSTGTPTTIPRATTPTTVASAAMGSAITVSTPRASSAFTHKLTYRFGSATGNIASNVTTSTTWAIPLSLANQIPNATSGTLTIVCETFNGNISLGTKTTTLTVTVPDTVKPTISSVMITEATAGLAAKFGKYIQYKSSIRVEIDAAGAYGSTIVSYVSTVQGITFKTDIFTTGTLDTVGTLPVTVTVTDSRGRKTTLTRNISVTAYYEPRIASFTAQRCDSSGTPKDDGTRLKIAYTFDVCPLDSLNDKSYKIAYRESSASTYITLKTGSEYAVNESLVSSDVFNVDNAYRVMLTVTDYFNPSGVSVEIEIPTSFSLMDFNASGKGIAIGEASKADELAVALPAHFKKAVEIDDVSLIPGLKETDWIYLTMDDAFKPYTDVAENTPKYRRRGKVVEIRGVVSPKVAYTSAYSRVTFATLPAEITPTDNIYQLCAGSNKDTWTLTVGKDGTLAVSQYGGAAYGTVSASARMVLQITYTLD